MKSKQVKRTPPVVIMGPKEVAAGVEKIKILQTGAERVLPLGEVVATPTLE